MNKIKNSNQMIPSRDSAFSDMLEFHAYSYQNSLGGTMSGLSAFPPDVIRRYSSQFGDWFN